MSDLAEQIREALFMFARNGTEPALIGGLAAVARYTRDTANSPRLAGYGRCANTLRCLTGRSCSMNFSDEADPKAGSILKPDDSGAVLAREAGLPFQPPTGNDSGVDPFAEWLSLMEVVQMLCPVWPARDKPMQGDHWRL